VAEPDEAASPDGRAVTVPVLANDHDVDAGAQLAVSRVAGQPIALGGSVVIPQGTITLLADGSLRFAPTPDANGVVRFSYEVSDGLGGTATGEVAVHVVAAGQVDPPRPQTTDAAPPISPLAADPVGDPSVFANGWVDDRLIRMPIPAVDAAFVQTAVQEAQSELGASDARSGGADPRIAQVTEIRSRTIAAGLALDPTQFVQNVVRSSQQRAAFLDAVMATRHGVLSLSSDQRIATPSLFSPDPAQMVPLILAGRGAMAAPEGPADPALQLLDTPRQVAADLADRDDPARPADTHPKSLAPLLAEAMVPDTLSMPGTRPAARSFSEQLRLAAARTRPLSSPNRLP
jgi:hypothetical protein